MTERKWRKRKEIEKKIIELKMRKKDNFSLKEKNPSI